MCPNRGEGKGIHKAVYIPFDYLIQLYSFSDVGRGRVFRNILIGLLVHAWLLAGVAFAFDGTANLQGYPSNILVLPPGEKAVVVDKARQRLYLFTATGSNRLALEKTMICATGEEDGDKRSLGDKRTPGGIYFCKTILIPPNLGRKYGTCALPLNYPNPMDKRNHRNGGGIWIHGIREDRTVRSSRGCVVLENENLTFLAHRVRLMTTPVIIDEHVKFVPSDSLAREAGKALEFLERWRIARATGNVKAYMACYAREFSSLGMDLSRWRDYKTRLFRRYRQNREVSIKNPMVLHYGSYEFIAFSETFREGGVLLTGYRRLYLNKIGDVRKIIGEEWIPSTVLRKKWKAYQEFLTKLKLPGRPYRIFYPLPDEKDTFGRSEKHYQGIRDFLENWRTAWESEDLRRYISCYSKQFSHDGMDLDGWKQYKSLVFEQDGVIHLIFKNVMVHMEGEKLAVRFDQIYQRGSYKDRGIKRLLLCREAGEWKILEETWQRKR